MKRFLFILLLITTSLYSYNAFNPIGFKATGMGGVGTANSSSSLAAYYNPALLLASPNSSEYLFGVGIRYREKNIADNLDQLKDLDISDTIDNIKKDVENATSTTLGSSQKDRDNIKGVQKIISNLADSNALELSVTTHLSAFIDKNFALGIYVHVDALLQLQTSKDHTELIFENKGNYVKYDPNTDQVSVSNKDSYEKNSMIYAIDEGIVKVSGKTMALVEIPLTFSGVSQYLDGYLAYGANVKYMNLSMNDKSASIDEGSDEVVSIIKDAKLQKEQTMGVDLGFAYQARNSGTIIGLVAKNINSPSFDIDSEEIKIKPAYRVGISRQLLNDFAEIAMDFDLTKNDTLLGTGKSQNVGIGFEIHPSSWFSFRGGIMDDIASSDFDDGYIYTAGFGFGLKWGQFDISAMMSDKKGTFDGDDIPRYAKVSFSLISKWGSR